MSNERGYICIALNNGTSDYVRMAYALALSLRLSQSKVRDLSIVVNRKSDVPDRFHWAFDHIIEMTGRDFSSPTGWRVENYHKLYEMTPYQETIAVDADMYFSCDISDWWQTISAKDVCMPIHVLNYKEELVTYNPFRKTFYEAGLLDAHNCLLYFNRSPTSRMLFEKMCEVTQSWATYSMKMFGSPQHFSSDAALVVSLRELGLEELVPSDRRDVFPLFIHMKSPLQGLGPSPPRDWRSVIEVEWNARMRLRLGGTWVKYPVHYYLRDFIGEDELRRLELLAGSEA